VLTSGAGEARPGAPRPVRDTAETGYGAGMPLRTPGTISPPRGVTAAGKVVRPSVAGLPGACHQTGVPR
jgi:hypothetical protein